MESKLTPRFYTRTGSTQAGLVEKDLAAADGEGDFGEAGDVLGGVSGEDDHSPSMPFFGNAAGTGGISDAFGGVSGERG